MARASVAVVLLWALLLPVRLSAAEEAAAPTSADLPETVTSEHVLSLADGGELAYGATAGFLPVGPETDAPDADIFYVAYVMRGAEPAERPISFVFNGGPGAASVYLHLGALGPRRLVMGEDGLPAPPPARLVNNPHSWLAFSDLVFVDPVGTGYSRSRQSGAAHGREGGDSDRGGQGYWGVERDLESLAAFIRLYLTRNDRWNSPKAIVGESYGGFRVARLVDTLQSDHLIPLNAAVLVSPALEFALQHRARFTLLPFMVVFPGMAAAAETHGRGALGSPDSVDIGPAALAEAEAFARGPLLTGLARGDALPEAEREALYREIADYLGLAPAEIARNHGRIGARDFAKLMLEEEGRLLGLYDASVSGIDPYADRPGYAGGDPSFDFLLTAFADAIVPYLNQALGFETDRAYESLNWQISRDWDWADGERGSPFDVPLGSVQSLTYGMSINPDMSVVIVHGLFDLVTPYFASHYLVDTMGLAEDLQENIRLFDYYGGHMFYTHEDSLEAFTEDLRPVYERMTGTP